MKTFFGKYGIVILLSVAVALTGIVYFVRSKDVPTPSPTPSWQWNTEWEPCNPSTGMRSKGWTGVKGPDGPQTEVCPVDCLQGSPIKLPEQCDKLTGKQLVYKPVLQPPLNGGKQCEPPFEEDCKVDCEVVWKEWEPCNTTLEMRAKRYEIVHTSKNGGQPCPPIQVEKCTD
jgi:hypothetical protein